MAAAKSTKKSTTKPSKTSSKAKPVKTTKASSKVTPAKTTKASSKVTPAKTSSKAKPVKASKASSKVSPAKSTKSSGKTKTIKTAKATAKPTTTKRVTPKSKTQATSKKSTTKAASNKKSTSPSKVVDFVADVVKQATKAQKAAQTQCKSWIKQLNTLDKQYAQLNKKQFSAKGKSLQTLEGKISKLKTQITAVRTSLLNAENNEDKIASLADFASQLNSRATPSSYLNVSTKPNLVKTNTSPYPSSTTGTSKPKQEVYLDEDDYPDEEDLDIDEDEEMGFVFGDDDELQDEESSR